MANSDVTELYCLFIAADNIVDAISFIRHIKKRYVNLYSGVSDRSYFKAAVQRQPQVRTMLEWRRLVANRKVRRMAVSIPNTAPVVHFTPSRSRYQFILLGKQRHIV